jgi:hypothetical protein
MIFPFLQILIYCHVFTFNYLKKDNEVELLFIYIFLSYSILRQKITETERRNNSFYFCFKILIKNKFWINFFQFSPRYIP